MPVGESFRQPLVHVAFAVDPNGIVPLGYTPFQISFLDKIIIPDFDPVSIGAVVVQD